MKGEIIFDKIVEVSLRNRRQRLMKEQGDLERFLETTEDDIISLQGSQQR